jgi:DNA-binding MarR family transcriptional regulator
MEKKLPATRAETIAALLAKSKRRNQETPVRRAFVQGGVAGSPQPGPLAAFVAGRDDRGLRAFTLAIGMASAPPHNIRLDGYAGIWSMAAAIGLPRSKQGVTAMSKVLARLKRRGLIERSRNDQGERVIRLLKEDGSGEPYVHPFRANPHENYFKIPFAYWLQDYDEKLTLASKAVLFIALSLPMSFILPGSQVKRWYGISADTLQRGLDGLLREELIRRRKEYKTAPLAPLGYTEQWRYRLLPPFGRKWSASDSEVDRLGTEVRAG